MKVDLKTKQSNFHKRGAPYRICEALESVFTAGEVPTILAKSMILVTLPTTVDLETQVSKRLPGSENVEELK